MLEPWKFALLLAATAALITPAPAQEIRAPWKHTSQAGKTTFAFNGRADGANWGLSISCSKEAGFGLFLVADSSRYSQRISSVAAKVGDGQSVNLTVKQDAIVPGLVELDGADALERSILTKETLSLKIVDSLQTRIVTFDFAGIKATKDQVMKVCPSF